jgi:hypothetical protein
LDFRVDVPWFLCLLVKVLCDSGFEIRLFWRLVIVLNGVGVTKKEGFQCPRNAVVVVWPGLSPRRTLDK